MPKNNAQHSRLITLIAALAEGGVIGAANTLPWHLPADLQHFRKLTLDKPVIMGRKTFTSIGRPLPRRVNIIVTRDQAFKAPGCFIAHSLKEALDLAGHVSEIMVIGGAELFVQALSLANRLELTHIDTKIAGDRFFPSFDVSAWKIVHEETHAQDAENPYPYRFLTYERILVPTKHMRVNTGSYDFARRGQEERIQAKLHKLETSD